MKRNLVIASVGDTSIHREWLNLPYEERDFDLMLIYFGDQPAKFVDEAQYYVERKGYKWQNTHWAVSSPEGRQITDRYDAFWFPDEDIRLNSQNINQAFKRFREYGLKVAQPALRPGPGSSHWITNPQGYTLRFTNFVEVMAPMFSRAALEKLSWTFLESVSSWGMDWMWSKFLEEKDMAIIDEVVMIHTRPVGGGALYKSLEGQKISAGDEFGHLVNKYGLSTTFKNFNTIKDLR